MKSNKFKYIYGLFALFAFIATQAQIVFHEDFGSSAVRTTSPYVPQGGSDTQHYEFADARINDDKHREINDNTYAVGIPSAFPIGANWATFDWWAWNIDHWNYRNPQSNPKQSITVARQDGAVMAVNAGDHKNQFYRRAVSLDKGATYRMTAYIRPIGGNVRIAFEAQNLLDDKENHDLGKKYFPSETTTFGDNQNGSDGWIELEWVFTVPNDNDNCGQIALSIRNEKAETNQNDFYIDDISLTKIPYDPNANVINCATPATSGIVEATNDNFTWGQTSYNIITNDVLGTNTPGIGFVFNGATKNTVISPVGTWPTGITINPTTGALEIAPGTTQPNTPLTYTICNLMGVCAEAQITFGTTAANPGTITGGGTICFGDTLTINGAGLASGTYIWQISTDNGITWDNLTTAGTATSFDVTPTKNAKVRVQVLGTNAGYSNVVDVTVVKNEIVFATQSSISVAEGEAFTLPTFDPNYTGTITIYRSDVTGTILQPGASQTITTAGQYTYIVKGELSTTPSCPVYSSFIVNVYGSNVDCTQGTELVFPATQSEGTVTLLGIPLGNVVDNNNALGRDLSIHSNINITLSALGLGTTWQNLIFAQAVPANTPITIKIGADSSILSLAGGVTAQPVNADGGLIGSPQAISGSLLELLTGENVYEITFTPLNNGTPIAYNGIRISLGALVGLGANVKVYGAYYQKETTVSATCINPVRVAAGPNVTLNNSIEDVSWGTNKILGIVGAVNGVLTPVNNPYHAIDNDLNTFATMNINVGVAQAQTLSVKLRKEALPGDELRLIIGSAETPLLDLSLIDNFSVQRYLGNVAVGTPVAASSFLLDLNLLGLLGSTGVKQSVIISAINQPFDRVVISYSSLVGVGLLGERMLVYDVAVVPSIGNGDPICLNETLDISKIDCSAYTVSMAYLNKTTNAFVDIANSTITSGYQDANNALYNFMSTYGQENLYVKIQMIRQGCDYGAPRYIKLENCLGNESIVNPVIKSGAK